MFEQAFMDFVTTYRFDVLSALKATDGEYSRLLERQTQYSVAVVSHDGGTLNMLVQDYLDCIQTVHDKESNALYLQGFKDGLTIAKGGGIL